MSKLLFAFGILEFRNEIRKLNIVFFVPCFVDNWQLLTNKVPDIIAQIPDAYKLSEDFVTPLLQTWQCVISSCGVSSRTMFISHHLQRHYQNCESASTPQSGTSYKTCLRGFGGNESIAWTSAVSHMGRISNAFEITMKLQTFLFQMVVTSCISVRYLWKYGFAKSSDYLYTPFIYIIFYTYYSFSAILYFLHLQPLHNLKCLPAVIF